VIGGILAVNGFTSFLSNVEEAKAAMDEGLLDLAALAEHAVERNAQGFINPPESDPQRGKLPREWANLFGTARLCHDHLAAKNDKGRETWVGRFLSAKTDRGVAISVNQQSGTATLRRNRVRSDQKRYYLEVEFPTPAPTLTAPEGTPSACDGYGGGGPVPHPVPGVEEPAAGGQYQGDGDARGADGVGDARPAAANGDAVEGIHSATEPSGLLSPTPGSGGDTPPPIGQGSNAASAGETTGFSNVGNDLQWF
jgi:hypothetical protein